MGGLTVCGRSTAVGAAEGNGAMEGAQAERSAMSARRDGTRTIDTFARPRANRLRSRYSILPPTCQPAKAQLPAEPPSSRATTARGRGASRETLYHATAVRPNVERGPRAIGPALWPALPMVQRTEGRCAVPEAPWPPKELCHYATMHTGTMLKVALFRGNNYRPWSEGLRQGFEPHWGNSPEPHQNR